MSESRIFDIPRGNFKVLGDQFKTERLKRHYSLRGMARVMHLAPTIISDIENGKRIAQPELLTQLYGHLGIAFLGDAAQITAAQADCKLFHEALYHRNTGFALEVARRLEQIQPSLWYSPLHVESMFFEVARAIFIDQNYQTDTLNHYEMYYSYFSDEQKQRFNYLLGHALVYNDAFDEGFAYLKRNESFQTNSRLRGMTLSMLAELYQYRHELYQAIEISRIATKIHAENANLYAKLETDWRLARNLIEVGNFDEARVLITYLELNIMADVVDHESLYGHVKFLRALAYYMAGEVREALAFMTLNPQILTLEYGLFFQALILERLNHKSDALAVSTQQLKDHGQSTSVFKTLAEYFVAYLNEDTTVEGFTVKLETLLARPRRIPSPFIFHWIHNCAMRFFEIRGEQRKALQIANRYMAVKKYY